MKVLVVKLTSMGDVLHLLPALTDLHRALPMVKVDWMVEENFAEIPSWHPIVDSVIPVATRRWRKLRMAGIKEFLVFWKRLRKERYDAVIDAQGLIKSAVFARFAKLEGGGRRIGFSANSIKEKPAAALYRHRITVARNLHAVTRLRQLLAAGLDYRFDPTQLDYNINAQAPEKPRSAAQPDSVLFLHGTTWPSKHLPESHWHDLATIATTHGYRVLLTWGNSAEQLRAERIASRHPNASVLPKSSISALREIVKSCAGAIAVDTGLGHLAAALGVPTVSIYGATDAQLTGTAGDHQQQMQTPYPCSPCLLKECNKLSEQRTSPPCYAHASPADIWAKLSAQFL